MKREIKFRGKRPNSGKWICGYLFQDGIYSYILSERFKAPECSCEVIPETVGQLQYKKGDVEYYDGDIYSHGGYGKEVVSELCELQAALLSGNADDIGHVLGNVHDMTHSQIAKLLRE